MIEYFTKEGFLERVQYFPYIGQNGNLVYSAFHRRFITNRIKMLGNPASWLTTVMYLDSTLNATREDTIAVLGSQYVNVEIIPFPSGGYISLLPQNTDTLRRRLFFFDGIHSRPYRSLLIDSGSVKLVPLSDEGALAFQSKFVTNSVQKLDSLRRKGRNTTLIDCFKRLDSAWHPLWTLDLRSQTTDSIYSFYTPAASIPDSPNDAIFYGTRVVSGVRSEPNGTFALVGRINGVGRIFDPTTALSGPRARPVPLQAISLYPNPATTSLRIRSEKALQYTIVTPSGAQVQQGVLAPSQAIDISTLPPGLYLLRLQDGGASSVARFVKN